MCTTEVLDMVENAWHPGPTMTFCRGNVSVAVVNDQLWAVGGFSGKNFLNNVEFLDPVKEEWTSYLPVNEDEEPSPLAEDEVEETKVNGNAASESSTIADDAENAEIEIAQSNGDE